MSRTRRLREWSRSRIRECYGKEFSKQNFRVYDKDMPPFFGDLPKFSQEERSRQRRTFERSAQREALELGETEKHDNERHLKSLPWYT